MYREDNPEVVLVECPSTEGNPNGFLRINKDDFIKGTHKLYVPEPEPSKYATMTVHELKDVLDEAGMDVPDHAKKADLVALCESLGA